MKLPTKATAAAAGPALSQMSRRAALALFTSAAVSISTPLPASAAAGANVLPPPMLPAAAWLPMSQFAETAPLATVPFKESFVIYLARFLLRYDEASATWYKAASEALPSAWAEEKKRAALNEALGEFAASLSFRLAPLASKAGGAGTMTLWEGLHASYSSRSAEAPAQLALLFSLLEPSQQPVEAMKGSIAKLGGGGGGGGDASGTGAGATSVAELVRSLERSADELLPSSLRPRYDESLSAFRLPSVELAQAIDGAPGLLGSIARAPLTVEKQLLPAEYGLFALSGGFGCAATHLAVVPLDVVKTRLQTRPGVYGGFADALTRIRKEEGLGMLFQGAQATGGGYFMYGVSVYPGYELAKRLLFEAAGPTATMEWRVPLVLLAGALIGSVVAMRTGDVGFVQPFRYSYILWAMLLGIMLFGNYPDVLTLAGAAVVAGCGIASLIRERRRSRPAPAGARRLEEVAEEPAAACAAAPATVKSEPVQPSPECIVPG